MLGSILSNLLLVLGCSFFFGKLIAMHSLSASRDMVLNPIPGGIKHSVLEFQETGAQAYVFYILIMRWLRR